MIYLFMDGWIGSSWETVCCTCVCRDITTLVVVAVVVVVKDVYFACYSLIIKIKQSIQYLHHHHHCCTCITRYRMHYKLPYYTVLLSTLLHYTLPSSPPALLLVMNSAS